jgi:deazaflavin-dependent oxidoreductase (nitroreductase family)
MSDERAGGSPILRAIMGRVGRPFNAIVLRFAGSRYLRLYGVVHHRGRRSGRAYATPVVVRQTAGGFVIPLAFGEGADWFQNLRAAGGCVVQWNGMEYAVIDPVVIGWSAARPAFGPLERMLALRLGIERFVRVRHAAAGLRVGDTSAQRPVDATGSRATEAVP